jgi:Fe-S-cluster-containing hydrogenase component 2
MESRGSPLRAEANWSSRSFDSLPSVVGKPAEVANADHERAKREDDNAVVILCSGGADEDGSTPIDTLAAKLQRELRGVDLVVGDFCSRRTELATLLSSFASRRIVLACSSLATRRGELLAGVRDAGVHLAGVKLVDVGASVRALPGAVAVQTVARIRAALASVSRADLNVPVRYRADYDSIPMSRRSILRPSSLPRRPVAVWTDDHCGADTGCRACVVSCSHNALSPVIGGIWVDAATCATCGACIPACPAGCLSLAGESLEDFEAAGTAIVKEAIELGLGVAIVCSKAVASVPLGGSWLPFEVPSLETVTAGWALQLLAAGVDVELVACGADPCASRARELTQLCESVAEEAPSRRIGRVGPARETAAGIGAAQREPMAIAINATRIELQEPGSTLHALASLGEGDATRATDSREARRWRIESAVSPLGELAIDPLACSACKRCALACPTRALTTEEAEGGVLRIVFDPSKCSACGACVASCPEGIVTLRRALDSSNLVSRVVTLARISERRHCATCGQLLGAGLAAHVIAEKLAGSHPEVAARLSDTDRCTDCLLATEPTLSEI